MYQHIKSVKTINSEIAHSVNALLPQKNRRSHSAYVLGASIFLLLGVFAYPVMGEVNFSVLVSPPVNQAITEVPHHPVSVKEVQPMYWNAVIHERKNPRLCYDYLDENLFDC